MRKPNGYWNIKENVLKEASKYLYKTDFEKYSYGAYKSAIKHKWINESEWMPNPNKCRCKIKWTKDAVFKESKKYHTRKEFKQHCDRAHRLAAKNGWIDEMEWLIPQENKLDGGNCVYVYVDEQNKAAYVGLTSNKELRHYQHSSNTFNGKKIKSSVYNYFTNNNIQIPQPIYLEDNLSREKSQIKEHEWCVKYKEMGYTLINKAKTGKGCGMLGRQSKWTKDATFNESHKYSKLSEFRKVSNTAYEVARKNGWIDEMFWLDKQPYQYPCLDIESCWKEAKKYTTISSFHKTNHFAYNSSVKNGIIDGIKIYYTNKKKKENENFIINTSKKYTTLKSFKKNERNIYLLAEKNNLLCKMTWLKEEPVFDLKGYVFNEAKKYIYKKDFCDANKYAYYVAKRNHWLQEMEWLTQKKREKRECPPRIWTEERIMNEAQKYTTVNEFSKQSHKAYDAARRYHLIDKLNLIKFRKSHKKKEKILLTKEDFFSIAKQYKRRGDFHKGHPFAYSIALQNKWLDEWFPRYVSKKMLNNIY